jgi:hypothetical protein
MTTNHLNDWVKPIFKTYLLTVQNIHISDNGQNFANAALIWHVLPEGCKTMELVHPIMERNIRSTNLYIPHCFMLYKLALVIKKICLDKELFYWRSPYHRHMCVRQDNLAWRYNLSLHICALICLELELFHRQLQHFLIFSFSVHR